AAVLELCISRPRLVAAKTCPLPSNVMVKTSELGIEPTAVHECPASVDRKTPWPAYPSKLELASPVPTQTEWSAGLTAIAPIARVGMASKSGTQLCPPLTDRHTPP